MDTVEQTKIVQVVTQKELEVLNEIFCTTPTINSDDLDIKHKLYSLLGFDIHTMSQVFYSCKITEETARFTIHENSVFMSVEDEFTTEEFELVKTIVCIEEQ